ncbi:MAG: rRNA (cytosine1402-N4)-methyltransferase [Candidatus Binataceae bacterium]|jgi:16S rRNA (cytosine1402-N4)-methyltransferase|nr:rRNA (cytosine1402-N4)-methyltransferase [Candidatus Binataceae bacterium]
MCLTEEKGQSAASRQHVAVMLDEVVGFVRALNPLTIVDMTVGLGGHAEALLRATNAHLIGIDRDAAALATAAVNLAAFGPRVTLRQADFSGFEAVLDQCGIPCVGAIIADLGMSSFALNDADRGFSFRLDGPLDMRMDRGQQLRAYDIINEETEAELARIIHEYGEEHSSRRIARAIVEARRRRPIETTGELSGLVESVLGRNRRGGIHPATRTFQALRIAVNHELESLDALLVRGPARLRKGGRMIVLAYHSLEDRPVKQRFRELVREGSFAALTRKALRPGDIESTENPRARSARLRCIERVSQ